MALKKQRDCATRAELDATIDRDEVRALAVLLVKGLLFQTCDPLYVIGRDIVLVEISYCFLPAFPAAGVERVKTT